MEQSPIAENAKHLRSRIDRIIEQYQNGDEKAASLGIAKVFEGILYSLTEIAEIRDSGEGNFQENAINALYSEKWITGTEKGKLHELRKAQNAFALQSKTDLSRDAKKKSVLQRYRDFFPDIIEWCREDVAWYERRAELMTAGVHAETEYLPDGGFRDAETGENGADSLSEEASAESGRERLRRLSLQDRIIIAFRQLSLPVAIASVLAVLFGLLSDTAFVRSLAAQNSFDFSQILPSHSMTAVFLLLIVLYVVFFHLTAQVVCGAFAFALANAATGSTACAVMTAVLMVLIVTRFTEKMRNWISYVFYAFWLLIFLCGMPSTLRERVGLGVPMDGYTVFVHVFLPMLMYVLIFILTPFVLKSFHLKRPFGDMLSDKGLHSTSVLLSLLLIAALISVLTAARRETWADSLILLTRWFYHSPSAFWTVHSVLIALVLYFFSIMKRYRTLH